MEPELDDQEQVFRTHADRVMADDISPNAPNWRKMDTTPREFFRLLGDKWLLGYRFDYTSI